jgi:aspartate/methionine/tyrosine aminotransferase
MAALGTENAFKLGEDIARCLDRGMEVVKFNLGEPDFDSAPHINQVAADEIAAGNSHYCDPSGILPFRKAIAAHIGHTRGLDVDPARIVVTPGAKPPISFSLMTYVDPGDEVIYPSPGFPIYESWVNYVGGSPVPLRLQEERGFAFGPEDLAALITDKTKVIILCSPSNPTGGVLSRDQLAGIAGVIRERCRPDVRIYSDEVYEKILFDGESHYSIASEEGLEPLTVLASGHSKSYAMTGWRLGWALLPTAAEAAIFKQLNINIVSCVPPFVQEAGREAYENPESDRVVGEMVAEFERRRDWIVPALNDVDGVTCQLPKGAFYVFPNIGGVCESLGIVDTWEQMPPETRSKTTPSGMFQMFLLYRYGVATMDRNSFGSIGAEGQHFLRLSIATSMEQCQKGVGLMREAAGDPDGFQRFMEEEKLWG